MRQMNRRRALATLAGAFAGGGCQEDPAKDLLPPTVEGIFGVSNSLTMAAQRLMLSNQSMAREHSRDMISTEFPTSGTVDPKDPVYKSHLSTGFRDWRLPVTGLVRNPLSLSLAELRALPNRTQVTSHSCEQGWTAVAEWTGVPLHHVLALAGLLPETRYILIETIDGWWATMDLFDALHAQTILAFGMNGGALPVQHGAPIRLRCERHLGYRQLKFVTQITVLDKLPELENGHGAAWVSDGYPWYAGI